jgi:hypothetical protein
MSWFSTWGWIDIFSVLCVFVGVVGEVWSFFMKTPFNPTGFHALESKKKSVEKWSLIILLFGIALEIPATVENLKEAADARLDATKLQAQINETSTNVAKLNPRSQAIQFITADVYLEVAETNFDFRQLEPDILPYFRRNDPLIIESKNVGFALAICECRDFTYLQYTSITTPGTTFEMHFSWPNPDMSWVVANRNWQEWIIRSNVSPQQLDRETAGVSFRIPTFMDVTNGEIIAGSCVVTLNTLNGSTQRRFLLPKYADEYGRIKCLPLWTNSP